MAAEGSETGPFSVALEDGRDIYRGISGYVSSRPSWSHTVADILQRMLQVSPPSNRTWAISRSLLLQIYEI
jgi:hypothetical protein